MSYNSCQISGLDIHKKGVIYRGSHKFHHIAYFDSHPFDVQFGGDRDLAPFQKLNLSTPLVLQIVCSDLMLLER